ncbi:MAG: protein-disulfide reductase DsbD family protein [Phycisphaerae bacterium]|nr:protein-disulfide reductase DsbD family protein [Phycisphaerae bacterium]
MTPRSLVLWICFGPLALGAEVGAADLSDTAVPPAIFSLVSEAATIVPGKPFTVGIHIRHAPGYHTYWKNPGYVGLPTSLQWQLPPGFKAGPIQWPTPQRTTMGVYTVWGYERDTLLLVDIKPPVALPNGGKVRLGVKARWMACARTCCPSFSDLSLTLPVTAKPAWDHTWRRAFATARALQPRRLEAWQVTGERDERGYRLRISPRGKVNKAVRDVYFYADHSQVNSNRPQTLVREGRDLILRLPAIDREIDYAPAPDPNVLHGVLYTPNGWLPGAEGKSMRVRVKLLPPVPAAGGAERNPPASERTGLKESSG